MLDFAEHIFNSSFSVTARIFQRYVQKNYQSKFVYRIFNDGNEMYEFIALLKIVLGKGTTK